MIRNCTNNAVLCKKELVAKSFFQRLTGMTTRKFSDDLDGIVFPDCSAVHTFGMRFDLDIIFVSRKNNTVVSVFSKTKPWKIVSAGTSDCFTIELPTGTLAEKSCKTGDILEFS